jgi:hypothetical protein
VRKKREEEEREKSGGAKMARGESEGENEPWNVLSTRTIGVSLVFTLL